MITNYPPRSGGVEAHVAGLAAALDARGWRVTVVTLDETPGVTMEGQIRVIRLPRRFRVGDEFAFPPFGTGRRIRRLLREVSATVVSTHTRFYPMSIVGVRAARRVGVTSLHTEHGSDFVGGVSPLIGLASRVVDHTLGVAVLRGASAVLGVSDRVVAFVERLSGVRASTFFNAIDPAAWQASLPAPAAIPARPRLVYVGRLVPGKGWDTTLNVAERLATDPDCPEFEVHLCGGGPDRDALARRAAASPLAARIHVRGRLSRAELAETLQGAVYVNPTTLSEGFQTTLLEALACGARVVTTDVAGAAELRDEGRPVRIAPTADAAALTPLVRDALDDEPATTIPSMAAWSWAARADEFAQHVARAT